MNCHPERSEGSAFAFWTSKWRYFRIGHKPTRMPKPGCVRWFRMASMKLPDCFLCLCFTWLCLGPLAILGKPIGAQTTGGPIEAQCEGQLGTTQAGMTLIVKAETITLGHYFTTKNLRDIPITGA